MSGAQSPTSSTNEKLKALLLHRQQQVEMYVKSPQRGRVDIPQLRAEDNAKLVDDAEAVKLKLREEYGEEIERRMAEKGLWKYSSRAIPDHSTEQTDQERKERRLKELLSDRTPLREGLLKAQEHALNSLIECTEFSLQNNMDLARSGASNGEGEGAGAQQQLPVTDTAALTDRLGTLLRMQDEHNRQMRCLKVLSDSKNFVVGSSSGDGNESSSHRLDAAKRAMTDGRDAAVEEAFDR